MGKNKKNTLKDNTVYMIVNKDEFKENDFSESAIYSNKDSAIEDMDSNNDYLVEIKIIKKFERGGLVEVI